MGIRIASAILAVVMLVGCGSREFHEQFEESRSELKGNSQVVRAPQASALQAAQVALVDRGFVIQSQVGAVISATRKTLDSTNPEISHTVNASVVVTADGSDRSDVSMSASEQATLHHAVTTWWHLFWLIPIIPTGTAYEPDVVIKEDTVNDPDFYSRFFAAVNKQVQATNGGQQAEPPQEAN
jgi:hypothetical protein